MQIKPFLCLILLFLVGCKIYDTKQDFPIEPESKWICHKWNIQGASITEADAKLWCYIINQDLEDNLTCLSAHSNSTSLILELQNQTTIGNATKLENKRNVYSNCYEQILVKNFEPSSTIP